MPRYRITLDYDGTPILGWQQQPVGMTVQGQLTEALRRLTGETISVRGAGRTDAGVHARAQVAHIDLPGVWNPDKLRAAINHYLQPDPIAVLDCEAVADGFDARFSATSRIYLYRILARRAPPALERERVWWVSRPLDPRVMHAAAQVLVGCHDFTTFRASSCQARSPIKTLERLDVRVVGSEIHVEAQARSFLHNQVRSMVGTLKIAGEGRATPTDISARLAARDRAHCGPVAPAGGLYLMAVTYAHAAAPERKA